MTFTAVSYALLLALTALLYFMLPGRMQNGVLLTASLVFYACNLPRGADIPLWQTLLPLLILCANIIFTWGMARRIALAKGKRRKTLTGLALAACVAVLCVFKYYNAFVPAVLGLADFAKLALPLGISFYTFAAVSYLIDVYRGDMPAAQKLLPYAAFITFFGTITSGPICRAQKVLPQLSAPRRFDAQRTCDALRLMLFGYFKWIAVANVLGLYVNQIFASPETLAGYRGLTLLFAAAVYAFQLYFEFAGYSDIARGTALLLGIDIPVNFKTPYFSMNFSAFWSRWHISLSTWLQDYIFMPLVWGRWTSHLPILGKRVEKPPMISSVAIVFIISGFWHGNTWPFVVWGCLQAAFRVGEELLHQWYKKPAKKPALPLRIFKTAGVFLLWSGSLVFFRVGLMNGGTVHDAVSYLGRLFTGWSPFAFAGETSAAIQAGFYTKPMMVAVYAVFVLFVLAVCVYADWLQCFRHHDTPIPCVLAKQKTSVRWGCYYVLIACVLLGYLMQSGGFGTVSFAYAQF
ncbi:MAG: MBOAT family O-acyltransferase [Ruthenibacterium sp.]